MAILDKINVNGTDYDLQDSAAARAANTYTKGEVDALVAAIKQFVPIVAPTLPTASADTMYKLYLVPSEDPKESNVKDEYITIDNGASANPRYTWEKIGSTDIDISGKADIDTVPTDVTRTASDATFVNSDNEPLFYLRQASSSLAGAMTAQDKTKLDALPTNAELTSALGGKQDTISDLTTIRSGASAGATAYQKPSGGIPASDMAQTVQTSLGKAETAVQPSDIPDFSNSSIVYDISKAHAFGGVLATYADLAAALGTNGANIPQELRKGGMTVQFVRSSDNKYVQWRLVSKDWSTDTNNWVAENEDFRNEVMREVNEAIDSIQPIEITGDVTNAPDEEDLTSVDVEGTNVLKFKDKAYSPLIYSGIGRVYLRKNIVNGVNVLTQDMLYKGEAGNRVPNTNTIFVIQYDYDLAGAEITIPEDCILLFKGGKLTNGTIVGQNTRLQGDVLLGGVALSGTFVNTEIDDSWFVVDEYASTWAWFNMLIRLANSNQNIAIYLNRDYTFDTADITEANSTIWTAFYPTSTRCPYLFRVNGSLRLYGNNNKLNLLHNGQKVKQNELNVATGFFFCGLATDEHKNAIMEIKNLTFDCGIDTEEDSDDAEVRSNYYVYVLKSGNNVCCIRQNKGWYKNIIIKNCHFKNSVSETFQGVDTISKNHIGSFIVDNCVFERLLGAGVNLNSYKGIISNCIFKNIKEAIEWAANYGNSLLITNCKFINNRLPIQVLHTAISNGVVPSNWTLSRASELSASIVNCYFENTTTFNTLVHNSTTNAGYPFPYSLNGVANFNLENCIFKNFPQEDAELNLSYGSVIKCSYEKCRVNGSNTKFINCCFNFEEGGSFINSCNNQYIENCRIIYNTAGKKPITPGSYIYPLNMPMPSAGVIKVTGTPVGDSVNSTFTIYTSLSEIQAFGRTFTSIPISYFGQFRVNEKDYQIGNRGAYARINAGGGTVDYKIELTLSTLNTALQGYGLSNVSKINIDDVISSMGYFIYDNSLKRPLWRNINTKRWETFDNAKYDVARKGTFADKPSADDIYVGFRYFCTDRKVDMDSSSPTYMQIITPVSPYTGGMEIIYKGSNVWVDALGRVVS